MSLVDLYQKYPLIYAFNCKKIVYFGYQAGQNASVHVMYVYGEHSEKLENV